VSDIDLFTGALGETPTEGSVIGPTFSCLLGRQFHYLRRGDRYWYENDLPPSSFSKGNPVVLVSDLLICMINVIPRHRASRSYQGLLIKPNAFFTLAPDGGEQLSHASHFSSGGVALFDRNF
jgi:hypothetical protein